MRNRDNKQNSGATGVSPVQQARDGRAGRPTLHQQTNQWLLQAGPGLSAAVIRGGRCDGNFSRLKPEQLLEQRQIFFHVTVRSLAGYSGPQFLAESRLQKSCG